MKTNQIEKLIRDSFNQFGASLAASLAPKILQELRGEIDSLLGQEGAASGFSPAVARKRKPVMCPVEGCGKPGGGPKWGWFCAEHKNLTKEEKEAARGARKSAKPGALEEIMALSAETSEKGQTYQPRPIEVRKRKKG